MVSKLRKVYNCGRKLDIKDYAANIAIVNQQKHLFLLWFVWVYSGKRNDSTGGKTMFRRTIIASALLLAALAASCAPARAQIRGVEFATYLNWGAETDAQFVFFMSKLYDYMAQELELQNSRYKHYTSQTEFYAKFVNGKGPRYALVGNRTDLVLLIRDHGFKPVIAYDVVGLKQNRECLYVNSDSGFNSAGDLRGKILGIDQGPYPFCLINDIVGERPSSFFSSIKETTTGLEAVYMLTLKKTDAIFATDQIMGFLKKNNPGAVHGLKRLECSPHYMFLPLLAKDAPKGLTDRILTLLKKVETGKALSQHQNIVRIQNLKFKPVSLKDFQQDIDFYTRAEKTGCVKAYEAWRKSEEKKEK